MPAITAADITKLERVPAVSETARQRPVREVVLAPHGLEGEGFPVRRAFAGADLTDLDPFVHMDQMGEVEYAPGEAKGTPWHPHRGFETVTYILDGVFEHQDSNGGGGVITNGDTQWMTAGAGILHIERPPERLVASGGLFHGSQLWVNLPKAEKWASPRYQDLRANEVSLLASPDAGALVRVIAGDVAGRRGPGQTYTPMTMPHATISPGARIGAPLAPRVQRAALRPGRYRDGRHGTATDPDRTTRRVRPGRRDHARGCPGPGAKIAGVGGACTRRPPHRRARRVVRAIRDEHPRRAAPGVRGLPGGPVGSDPCHLRGSPHARTHRRAGPGTGRLLDARLSPRPRHGAEPTRRFPGLFVGT